ncbi:MAG: YihY/virulence factor BrkB family protein [Acidimicrobiales bacterium]
MPGASLRERIDAFQQRHLAFAFPYAVHKRFTEDRGKHYASLISYYGFFSLFPLLLAFVSLLGIVLRGRTELQQDIIDSALGRFPVLGDDLTGKGALTGSGWALAFGLAAAVWAGLGVVYAAQDALDTMWDVPRVKRPNFLFKRLRAIAMLGVVGAGTIAGSAVAGVATQLDGLAGLARVATALGTIAVNTGSLLVGYRLLTVAKQPWRVLLPGSIAGGIVLTLLQTLGGWYLTRVVAGASDTYGTFSLVIGLLTWLSLQARIVLYAAEVNVVRANRLWPRSMGENDPLDKDVASTEPASTEP